MGRDRVRLHVLTAATRPENFPAMYESIYAANHPDWQVYWHILHLDGDHVGGQTVKNWLLDELEMDDGWVYILDDDNLMHPAFLSRTAAMLKKHPETQILFVARVEHGNVFQPEVKVGHIDIGQALIRLDLIEDLRIPDLYDGDGWFLQTLVGKAKDSLFVAEPLSFYNRLR